MCAFGSVLGIKSKKSLMLRLAVIMIERLANSVSPSKKCENREKCKNKYISK